MREIHKKVHSVHEKTRMHIDSGDVSVQIRWRYALEGGECFAADWGVDVAHHGSGRRLRLQRHVHRLTEL